MTSVQWLENELKKIPFVNPKEIFKQAKEMEKQQIIDAFDKAYMSGYRDNGDSGIDYFTETYGSKGSETKTDNI